MSSEGFSGTLQECQLADERSVAITTVLLKASLSSEQCHSMNSLMARLQVPDERAREFGIEKIRRLHSAAEQHDRERTVILPRGPEKTLDLRMGRVHLAAEGETRYDLYHLCVEMATAQNPPHLPILGDFGGSGSLASA